MLAISGALMLVFALAGLIWFTLGGCPDSSCLLWSAPEPGDRPDR